MFRRTPQEVLRRTLRLASFNGWTVTLFAGFCVLVSLAMGDLVGTGVAVMFTIGGIMELRGRRKLQQRDIDGMHLLVRSQLFELGVMLMYAVSRLFSFDPDLALGNETAEMKTLLTQAGVNASDLLSLVKLFFYVTYGVVIVVTICYQGGLAWLYHRRTPAVQTALTALPVVPGMQASSPPVSNG